MFTQKELLEQLLTLIKQDTLPMEQVEYDHKDFKDPDSEQVIIIHCGLKTAFDNALHFWVQSLRAQDWLGRQDYFLSYARSGKCTSITTIDFDRIVQEYSHSLKTPFRLTLKGVFISAMQMYDDWNDIALLAEFSTEYVAFYWSTTA